MHWLMIPVPYVSVVSKPSMVLHSPRPAPLEWLKVRIRCKEYKFLHKPMAMAESASLVSTTSKVMGGSRHTLGAPMARFYFLRSLGMADKRHRMPIEVMLALKCPHTHGEQRHTLWIRSNSNIRVHLWKAIRILLEWYCS